MKKHVRTGVFFQHSVKLFRRGPVLAPGPRCASSRSGTAGVSSDEGEDFLASRALFRRGDEHRRQFLPLLGERGPEPLHALFALGFRELVGLGEDDAEGDAVFAQHLDEPQVDLLGFEPDVHQHEQEVHLLALDDVVGDQFRKLAALGFRRAGVAVAGQVDQIPGVVDAEVVYEARLSGRSRHLGQSCAGGEHVDERRFSDVAPPDEGDVFQVVLRNLGNALGGAFEFGFGDLHRYLVLYKGTKKSDGSKTDLRAVRQNIPTPKRGVTPPLRHRR